MKKQQDIQIPPPKEYYLEDDGSIPNSKYPLLLYKVLNNVSGYKGADWFEERFNSNGWTNSWRWGIYSYHHYHSNTHEVLGVFKGTAELLLGGDNGIKTLVYSGDVIVIPAGVGHKCLSHTKDFTVVGAYPNGAQPDINKGVEGERPLVDQNLNEVPFPDADPLLGKEEGLLKIWK